MGSLIDEFLYDLCSSAICSFSGDLLNAKHVRKTYPQAQVQTFHDAGHASSILKREEAFSVIRNFLSGVLMAQESNDEE